MTEDDLKTILKEVATKLASNGIHFSLTVSVRNKGSVVTNVPAKIGVEMMLEGIVNLLKNYDSRETEKLLDEMLGDNMSLLQTKLTKHEC